MKKREVKFEPLGDRLLINQVDSIKRYGLIWVPSGSEETPPEGVVYAVGKGPNSEQICVICAKKHESGQGSCFKKGQIVMFGRFAGASITYRLRDEKGDTYGKPINFHMVREEDVLCFVEVCEDEQD